MHPTTWLFLIASFALAAEPSAPIAPSFSLPGVDGEGSWSLSSRRGHVVVLSFWATWCGPCKKEMPHLDALYRQHGEAGLDVWTINVDDRRTRNRVEPWLRGQEFSMPALRDADRSVFRAYNPSMGLPYTVLVGPEGEVRGTWQGFEDAGLKDLKRSVAAALDAMRSAAEE